MSLIPTARERREALYTRDRAEAMRALAEAWVGPPLHDVLAPAEETRLRVAWRGAHLESGNQFVANLFQPVTLFIAVFGVFLALVPERLRDRFDILSVILGASVLLAVGGAVHIALGLRHATSESCQRAIMIEYLNVLNDRGRGKDSAVEEMSQ